MKKYKSILNKLKIFKIRFHKRDKGFTLLELLIVIGILAVLSVALVFVLNPDEIMWRIAIEEIIYALQQEAVMTVIIPAGTTLTAAGISGAGPVTVFGSTITTSRGYGVIQ